MKVFAYSYREFDEDYFFKKFSSELDIELGYCTKAPSMDNAKLAQGYDAISVITTPVDEKLVERFHELGIRFISTRTIGYDHIAIKKAKELGINVGNATYSPCCVADYTVMLMLMTIRKMKRILQREEINDFSLPGIQGRELHNFTVGILGTGKIGSQVARNLSGFGCRVLLFDKYENTAVKAYGEYVSFETILKECDMISLHMPLLSDNFHIIDKKAIEMMKDDVVIINTARGGLIDTDALIDGLMSGKISACGLDVVEDEFDMYYYDRKSDVLNKKNLYILRGLPNVIITPHMAFYTDQAISDMVKHSLMSCKLEYNNEEDPWRVS